jgi:xanthine/uracil permease
VVTLVRLGRIIVILLLATFTLAFVIGVARSETGAFEKIVLVGLVVGCVVLAARVSASSADAERRLRRR